MAVIGRDEWEFEAGGVDGVDEADEADGGTTIPSS